MNAPKDKPPKRTHSYVEEVFSQILQKPEVLDIVVLNKIGNPIKTTMDIKTALEFGGLYETLLQKVQWTVQKLDPGDEVLMLRVRTKTSETLMTPDESITVIVVQNAEDRRYF